MQTCKVCKQEILPTDMTVENGTVHKNGACDVYLNETKTNLNEATDIDSVISETKLL